MHPLFVLAMLWGVSVAHRAQGNANPLAVVSCSPEFFQRMVSKRMDVQIWKQHLQKLPLHEALKGGIKQGGLLGGLPIVGGLVNNVLGSILGVKIKKVELLKLDIQFDEREKHIFITIPADLEVEISLPFHLGRLLHIKLFLDVQVGVQLTSDPITGYTRLVLGNCQNNPGHVRVTLLDNSRPLAQAVNNLLRTITDVLEKTIPHLLQKQLCPIANGVIQAVLDIFQGAVSSQAHGETICLSSSSFSIQEGVLVLGYQGKLQLPGAQVRPIQPGPDPLPRVPLAGSALNMQLSDRLLDAALRASLPPRTVSIDAEQEVAAFRQQIAEVPGAALPAGMVIGALQVRYEAPALLLARGKIQVQQQVEIGVYGNRPRSTRQLLLTFGAKVSWHAGVSVTDGRLKFILGFEGMEHLSLSYSSIKSFNAQYLGSAISHLVSTHLLKLENSLLDRGFPLPLLHGLGFTQLNVTPSQDALLVYDPPSQGSGQVPVCDARP